MNIINQIFCINYDKHINSNFLLVCSFVCLYPIDFKTAEPIGYKNVFLELQTVPEIANICFLLKILNPEKELETLSTTSNFLIPMYL